MVDIDDVLRPVTSAATPEDGLRAGAMQLREHGPMPILMSAIATRVGQWCKQDGNTVEECADILGLPPRSPCSTGS